MKTEVNVVLLGFAAFEKSTFESFFKLVGRRDTLYKPVSDVSQAEVLLVNSDSPAAVQWSQTSAKTVKKAIFVGAPDPLGNWPNVPRPIKLTTVLGLLDALVLADPVAFESAHPAEQAQPEKVIQPVVVSPAKSQRPPEPIAFPTVRKNMVRQGSGRSGTSEFAVSNFMGISAGEPLAGVAEQFDDILVVDDSDVALKFMQNRLTRYGFHSELAKSGEEALTRISASSYKFVFLDVMMDGLDGYQTCRAIKQRKYPSGRAPVVVMLTSRGGSIDKIRGGLAGCDAYLTKPLNEVELLRVLSKHDDQVERSFRDTNLGRSGISSFKST